MAIAISIFVLLYLIGCVLSFGMHGAWWYEIDEKNIPWGLPEMTTNREGEFISFTLMSWFAILMNVAWHGFKRKYWFKFSYKTLREKREAYILSGDHDIPKHETFLIN